SRRRDRHRVSRGLVGRGGPGAAPGDPARCRARTRTGGARLEDYSARWTGRRCGSRRSRGLREQEPEYMLDLVTVSDWRRALALATFVASYVGLGLGRVPGLRVDRTGVAIIGAAVMVVSGAVPWADAVVAVDAPTLVLLFGMMIVTAYLRLSGFFGLVMTWALRRARTPLALLAAVVVASGVLSAFFVNDVVCLVLAPVVLQATRELALPPVPYLVALATAANVGSVATLTGNPQNMLVGSFSGISYR